MQASLTFFLYVLVIISKAHLIDNNPGVLS